MIFLSTLRSLTSQLWDKFNLISHQEDQKWKEKKVHTYINNFYNCAVIVKMSPNSLDNQEYNKNSFYIIYLSFRLILSLRKFSLVAFRHISLLLINVIGDHFISYVYKVWYLQFTYLSTEIIIWDKVYDRSKLDKIILS